MPAVYSEAQVTQYIDDFFQRFQRIERQLALLSEKLGVAYDHPAAGAPPEVVALAQAGDRMGAVKKYRELTGAGFEEARDFVAEL